MSGRRLAGILAIILMCIAPGRQVSAAVDPNASFQVESNNWAQWPQAADVQAKTGVVMEAETGAILYAKGMDAQRYPASLTKIMTALLLVEHCDMDEQITMTEIGLADTYDGSSNCNPVLGEVFTAEQCLQMILIKSANDVATETGAHIGGSVQGFADMMNARARELGCANTNFCNASGLEDANHYTSAHDLALMTREALKYDKFRETFGIRYVTIPATNTSAARGYGTHIMMLDTATPYYYEGCFGGKTGFTDEAQNCLMVCAERDGVTLIGILMDCQDGALICQEMAKILDYGFAQFTKVDASDGLKVSAGGKAMVPAGVAASDLEIKESEAENGQMELSYEYQGRVMGTASVRAEEFADWQKRRESQSNSAISETGEASEGGGHLHPQESGGSSASRTLMYVGMGVLGALILAGILLIFVGAHRNKRREGK